MITAWIAIAMAAPVGLDRVDLIAEGPGTFINYDVPVFTADLTRSGVRFVEQIQPVWYLPVEHLFVGTSITSQSLIYERPIGDSPISVGGALETSLLVPRGLRASVAVRGGPVRVALGVSALTPSGWRRFDYNTWTVMPTLGLGLTRKH